MEDRVLVRLAKSWEVISWSLSREGETASGEAMWLGILVVGFLFCFLRNRVWLR